MVHLAMQANTTDKIFVIIWQDPSQFSLLDMESDLQSTAQSPGPISLQTAE